MSSTVGAAPERREVASKGDDPHGPVQPEQQKLHPEVRSTQLQDVFAVLIGLRFINALLLRTFFQPDEYFQSLEPAWALAFGPDSGAWATWEWEHQLRSSLHPVLFGLWYMVAHRVMSYVEYYPAFQALVLPVLPRIVQSVFAALGDFYTWRLAEEIYGQGSNAAWSALWMTVLNPWQWYCSTRTFSNSLEMSLTAMALYYWPWDVFSDSRGSDGKLFQKPGAVNGLRVSLLLAAVAVVLRPTNLLIWLAILTLALSRMTLDGESPLDTRALLVLIRDVFVCGSTILGISLVSDRLYFGEWTFPPYKWLYFNISQSLAVFYGRSPWHYYLLQGIPLLTTTFLPFVVLGLLRSTSASSGGPVLRSNTLKALSFSVLSMVATLSLISHKEVRFIYPLLPILHILAAPYIASYFTTPDTSTVGSASTPASSSYRLIRKPLLLVIVLVNLILGAYLSLFHQSAPLSVLSFLHLEYERLHPDHLDFQPPAPYNDELFALFLTPCHSTPWRSHLVHSGLRARALTCEPPLHTAPGTRERSEYLDEADRFYARAADGTWGSAFLDREIWPSQRGKARGGEVPRYIVGFEGIEGMLREFFAGPGSDMGVDLQRVWQRWNGLFHEDWRRQGSLVVWDTGIYPGPPEGTDEDDYEESL